MKRKLVIVTICLNLICLGVAAVSAQTRFPNLIVAQKALESGDWDTAITYFTKSIETGETKGNVLLSSTVYGHRCQAYFTKKKFDLAIADCDKAIEIKPDVAYVYHIRASSLSMIGKFDRAIADYTHAIQLEPASPDHYVSRGMTHSSNGNRDQAIADFGKAIELDPKDEGAYLLRATAFRQKGDYDQALIDYQALVKLAPNMLEAYVGLGLSYRHKKDYVRAVESFNKGLTIDPRSKDALLFRGVVYADQGDYDRAIRDYTEALRIDPSFISPYPIRGDAYVKKGDYRSAIADYTKRLQLDPNATTLYSRAWANLYANNSAAAFADAQKYVEPNGSTNFGSYAVMVGYLALRKADKPTEGKVFLANALKQAKADAWTTTLLRYLNGDLNAEQLLALSTDDDKLTESHAYIGVVKILGGDANGGRTHLEWVKANGKKSFAEYDLALAELARLPKTGQ